MKHVKKEPEKKRKERKGKERKRQNFRELWEISSIVTCISGVRVREAERKKGRDSCQIFKVD